MNPNDFPKPIGVNDDTLNYCLGACIRGEDSEQCATPNLDIQNGLKCFLGSLVGSLIVECFGLGD